MALRWSRKLSGGPKMYGWDDTVRIDTISIQRATDTVILSYRYTNMVTAAKMKQLFQKESSCFLKTKSSNITHHLFV